MHILIATQGIFLHILGIELLSVGRYLSSPTLFGFSFTKGYLGKPYVYIQFLKKVYTIGRHKDWEPEEESHEFKDVQLNDIRSAIVNNGILKYCKATLVTTYVDGSVKEKPVWKILGDDYVLERLQALKGCTPQYNRKGEFQYPMDLVNMVLDPTGYFNGKTPR